MFNAIKRLLGGARPPNALWKVMEERDPWLSYDRFLALKLPKRQRPTIQALVEGSIKPGEIDGVRRWAGRHEEDYNGIAALVYALQQAIGSRNVHYLFEDGTVVPTARFLHYVDDQSLTLLFNDRTNSLQIASLKEFIRSNDLQDHVLEPLSFGQYETTIERRAQKYLGVQISQDDKEESLYQGRRISITIYRRLNADQQIEPAVTAVDISAALCVDGIELTPENVMLDEPIREPGSYNVTVQVGPGVSKVAYVWVVPTVE